MSRFGFGFGFGASFGSGGGGVPLGSSSFITIWDTENLGGTGSLTKVILLPITAGPEVDWGDGTVDNLNTHTYAVGGIKTVTISGPVTGWVFANMGDKLKLTEVLNVGELDIDSPAAFYGCSNMTWTATSAPTISGTDLNTLFRACTIFNGAISNWNVSSVLNFSRMFQTANTFNVDISSWDMSSATITSRMFQNSGFNQDLTAWNIGAVTTMANMFDASSMSTVNYSNYLISCAAQTVQPNVVLGATGVTYNAAGAIARASLIADDLWTITDAGLEP